MSLTLVDYIRKQANLKGYKPRIGIEIPSILQNFSRSIAFDVTLYSGTNGSVISGGGGASFTSVGKTFDDDGIIVTSSDILIIVGSVSNDGEYTITSITSNTVLECLGAGFTTESNLNYRIVRRYQDLLVGVPSLNTYSGELGGYSPQSDLSFSILNNELWSDILATYTDIENSDVNVILYFDDGTDILYTEKFDVYTGKIKTLTGITHNSVEFSVTDSTILKSKYIGTILTPDTDEELPSESVGKTRPIIYGDHRSFFGDTTASNINLTRKNNGVPARYLGIDDAGNHRWLLSDHEVNAVDEIFGFDPAIDRMVHLPSANFTVEQNTSDGCIISHADQPDFVDYWYPDGSATIKSYTGSYSAINLDRSANKNVANYAQVTVLDLVGAGTRNSYDYYVHFEYWDNTEVDDADISGVDSYCLTSWVPSGYGGDPPYPKFEVDTTLTSSPYDITAGTSATYLNWRSKSGAGANAQEIQIDPFFFVAGCVSAGVDNPQQAEIYQVFKKITYKPTAPRLQIYFGGRGREYGTWIDSRTQSVPHIDNNNSGDLIENYAGILESIFRDSLGLVDADINLDSFNIASNDLSTTVGSFDISDQITWFDMVASFAETCKSNVAFDSNDLLKMIVFDAISGFSASGKTVPNNWDIFENSPVETFLIITSYNDRIYLDDGGALGLATITVPSGLYTGATLAIAIRSAMVGDGTYNDIKVTYSSTTGKFTFLDDAGYGGVTVEWATSPTRSIGRFIGFDISADDIIPDVSTLTSDFGLWDDSWVENPMVEESFKLVKQTEDIVTDVTVDYYKDANSSNYQSFTNDTDTSYHAEVIANIFNDDFTKDTTTAIVYRDFLLDRLAKRHYVASFTTFINGIHIELWDIINIRHPIIEGIFTETVMNAKEWLVLDVSLDTSSMEITVTAIEV
mgnify:CR=1 FL=1